MGMSPEGVLFYGLCFDSEFDRDIMCMDDYVVVGLGLTYIKYKDKGHDAYFREKQDLLKVYNLDTVMTGYDGEIAEHIVIKSTISRSEWGEIVNINSLEIDPEWTKTLERIADTLNLKEKTPRWVLSSLYL